MSGGKHLLLLAALLHLARCQTKPQVYMSPNHKQIFLGDVLNLRCASNASTVKWYFDGIEEPQQKNKIWKIEVAALEDSGSYQCESNGEKSDKFSIAVLEYDPSASLTIKTGNPVMKVEQSVILQLDNDNGLQGWRCWVLRGQMIKKIMLKLTNGIRSIVFQPSKLTVPETIFWCTDKNQTVRSNQQVIRTSDKEILLEMYPRPALVGESLTLTCLVLGTDRISKAAFYRENQVLVDSATATYKISNVKKSTKGRYKCDATYTHVARTGGPPYRNVSDMQDVFVQEPPIKAVLTANGVLSCSCPRCEGEMSYHFYKENNRDWVHMGSTETSMTPNESGTYACRAVMKNMRSLRSNGFYYKSGGSMVPGVIVVGVIILGVLLVVVAIFYKYHKKRSNTGPIYEDMPMRSRDEGGDKYEELQKAGGMEREYDTLQTETQGRNKKEGEYEGLKKQEMQDGVYHTLGMEAGAGGGGYEALKKEGMKEGVYHTLGMEEGAGGGGYEALKKEGMKEGVYNTLGMEAGAGGGGYEALKKEGMKEGVYNTLGEEGAGGGGYEALKKEGMKEGVYNTLGEEGAGGGGYEALKKEGMKGDEYQTLQTGGAGGEG